MTYQTFVPAVNDSYASSGCGDDLAIATLWLGLAKNDSTLTGHAKEHYDHLKLDAQLPDSEFHWDSPMPGSRSLGHRYTILIQLGGNGWQSRAELYLDRDVSGKGEGNLTKGSAVPGSSSKILTGRHRWISLLQGSVGLGELESSA